MSNKSNSIDEVVHSKQGRFLALGAAAVIGIGSMAALAQKVFGQPQETKMIWRHYINDGTDNIMPDKFVTVTTTDPNALVGYDILDDRQPPLPPSPPDKPHQLVQAFSDPAGVPPNVHITGEYQPLSSDGFNNVFSVILKSLDIEYGVGFTGEAHFNLDPNSFSDLAELPDNTLSYFRRYDNVGTTADPIYEFVETHPVIAGDPNSYDYSWPVYTVQGIHGKIDIIQQDACIACDHAKSDGLKTVNLGDFAVMAAWWLNDAGVSENPVPGDIYKDNNVDIIDLEMFKENWLCTYGD